jgi:transposase-like protein
MHKTEKSKANNTGNSNKMTRFSFSEELDDFEFDDNSYNSKMKIECICPKCGQRHVMAFHWIGRGTPRKYCPSCKGGSNG